MKNQIKVLYKSYKYTNFYSVFVLYKNRKFNIKIYTERGDDKINCTITLFSNDMLYHEDIVDRTSILDINTNNFSTKSLNKFDDVYRLIDDMYEAAVRFIQNVF